MLWEGKSHLGAVLVGFGSVLSFDYECDFRFIQYTVVFYVLAFLKEIKITLYAGSLDIIQHPIKNRPDTREDKVASQNS